VKRASAARAVTSRNDGLPSLGPKPAAPPVANPLLQFQRDLGNQGMQRLLESGGLQAKLRVSEPGDADEQEADRAAEHIISAQPAPRLQRKCACGGTCAQCRQDEEPVVHRRARRAPDLRPFPFSIQRQAATSATEEPSHRAAAAEADTRRDQAKHPGEHPRTLIVDDEAPSLGPGQMRKQEFVSLLQTTTCATADAVLESVGHTTKGCPYVKKWLEYYKGQDASHLTRAMHKYAPDTVRARSAHEAIALLNHRVQRVAMTWAKTGKVSDLPEGMRAEDFQGEKKTGGFLEGVQSFAHSGFGSALLGFIGGGKTEGKGKESKAGLQRKSRDGASAAEHDAASVKEQLGAGQSLDGGVGGRMSAAFGYDFSGVRVHTDAKAGELSGQLQARAFTIGSDVAFARGEYKPGTLVGDALIAHELAHVVQQSGGTQAARAQTKDASFSDENCLEQDADRSAVGAVVSAWTGATKGLANISAHALPKLKSGLKLQKCNGKGKTAAPGWSVEDLRKNLRDCDPTGMAAVAQAVTVNVGRTVLQSGGQSDPATGAITLDPGQDKCTATQVLIQEASNHSHESDFAQVDTDAAAGRLSRDEYIRRNERYEYDGVRRVIQAFDACKGIWGCATCEKEWARRYATFEDYFDKALSSGHKEYYGTEWDRRYKAAYERAHPATPPAHH